MQIGPYRVVEEIARGGMGVVYRAQGADGKQAALKLLLAQRSVNPRARKRFQLEVRALARLRHPNVVPILDAGEHEGTPWLALDYVEGESLEARLRRGPLPVHEAIRVAQQLAQALIYVHSCGLLHRDLKPDNVLLRGDQALLTDFGLVLDDQSSHSRLTATGVFQGTPGYWAPEQARGETSLFGPTTDVFGLGAVLYACLTGHAPVEGASLQDYLQTARIETIQSPQRVRPEVPEWLSALCMRCLKLRPETRPASVEEVARSLVTGGLASEAEPRSKTKRVAAVVGLAAVASLVVGWGLSASPTRAEPGARSEPIPLPATNTSTEQDEGASESDRREQILTLADSARAKARGGQLEAAIEDYTRILQLDPRSVTGLLARGHTNRELGRHALAISDYERVLELEPRNTAAYGNRGLSYLRLGQLQEALADLDRAIELNPRYALAFNNRAAVKQRLGRLKEALTDYHRSLELDPSDAQAHRDKGVCLLRLERFEDALQNFDRALELDPSYATAYQLRGTGKARLGQHEWAIVDYDQALELDPRYATAYANRGASKDELGHYGEAIEDYDRALEHAEDPVLAKQVTQWRTSAAARLTEQTERRERAEVFFRTGEAEFQAGRYEEALAAFDKALELDPGNAPGLTNRGALKAKLGRTAEAVADYDAALELNPRDAAAYRNRGRSKASLKRFVEAIEDFDAALELNPRDANAFANRGAAKANLDRNEEAIEDLDQALALDPRNAFARKIRGVCKTRLARYAEAIDDFDKALELGLPPAGIKEVEHWRAKAAAK